MRWRRLLPLALVASLGACAYFNGIYNAREAERHGAKLLRAGKDGEASGEYAVAAQKAETVLARYPKSRWRSDALLIAGRGAAYSNQCERGITRLLEFLATPGLSPERRAEAELPLGRCYVAKDRYTDGLALLAPLTTSRDDRIARQASIWAARASIALGHTDDATRYLRRADAASAEWELALASLAARDYERAESLLVLRARRGDYRDDMLPAIRELWRVGRRTQARAVVLALDGSRAGAAAKARVHLGIADLLIDAGQDSLARGHLERAQRVAADSVLDAEAAARLTLLSLHDLATLADVQGAINRSRSQARGAPLQKRMEDNLLLLDVLQRRVDYTGASVFLAAEVARDSLRAPRLAHTLFKRVVETTPAALVAPKALLAAAELMPDSADAYRRRIIERYPRTGFAIALTGGDPASVPSYAQADELLRQSWKAALDTLVNLQAAARQASAGAGPPSP